MYSLLLSSTIWTFLTLFPTHGQHGERLDELEACIPLCDVAEFSLPQHGHYPSNIGTQDSGQEAASPDSTSPDGTHNIEKSPHLGGSEWPPALTGGVPVEIVSISTGARHRLEFFDDAQARRFSAVMQILRRVTGKCPCVLYPLPQSNWLSWWWSYYLPKILPSNLPHEHDIQE